MGSIASHAAEFAIEKCGDEVTITQEDSHQSKFAVGRDPVSAQRREAPGFDRLAVAGAESGVARRVVRDDEPEGVVREGRCKMH